jgi:hypothetical protein
MPIEAEYIAGDRANVDTIVDPARLVARATTGR